MSGKKRFISIINPAVNVIQIVNKTGAVDKYFCKFSIDLNFIKIVNMNKRINEVIQLLHLSEQLNHY